MAVRQAALLTYELLGGEKNKEGEVKRWFKPVNGLGDAGNSILYDGLQGSPRFETSEDFFHKLESAIRSGAGASRALPAPALQTREHSVALPDTNLVIRRFNRDTGWLATGVLGAVVFAALMLAVLVQDRHPRAVDLTKEAVQAVGDLLPNANSAPTKNPSSQMEAAASTLTAVVASNPEINHTKALANANTWFPADRRHSMRVIRPKIPNVKYRSSLGLIFVDVKMRLIALWHKTLMRSEKSRISTISLNWNRGERW